MSETTNETKPACAASAVERRVGPWPAATGRAETDGWKIDPELLVRIKRDISLNEETRYGLDMEQIETVMLALVRIGLAPNDLGKRLPEAVRRQKGANLERLVMRWRVLVCGLWAPPARRQGRGDCARRRAAPGRHDV